jgi:GTP-binding protein EngB required for normal cell division
MSRGLVEILGSMFGSRRRGDDSRPVEVRMFAEADFASIYARNPASSILASVLSETEETRARRRKTPAIRESALSGVQSVGIGEALQEAREAVLKAGEALVALSDDTFAGHIRRLLGMVEEQHCNIAFIGQMNAGKSSLINAFIGVPRFLPTEITPWTTVVTNLYFGIPKMPVSGTVFEFFSPAEWQQLAEGSSRVRALTERLVPDFPWEDFYRQVGSMREKAETRLGSRYAELLGTQHAYPTVTTEILEKYITAESPLGDVGPGEFSMITKAAHLYFDLTSFYYPTVVIDTPGVNDPFLVRDEITRQNLERANIFVIVVTARQPLSTADLDLLRILRGLKKDNIVIYVNKIDELDDFPAHSQAIIERINGLLKREFPGADIPIVAGSAFWAEVALGDDVAEKQRLASSLDTDGASMAAIAEEGGFLPADAAVRNARLTDTLLMRSGVPDLALAVSAILQKSESARSIRYAASVLAALARNGRSRTLRLGGLAEQRREGGEGWAPDALLQGVNEADAILNEIEGDIVAAAEKLGNVLAGHEASLIEMLRARMKARLAALPPAAEAEQAAFQLTSLVVKLRSELEQEFLAQFRSALAQITALARNTEESLRVKFARTAARLGTPMDYAGLPPLVTSPSLTALGDPVATDLGSLVHGHWGGKPEAIAERTEEMRALIIAEFETIADKLAKSAKEELRATIAFILDHFHATALHTLERAITDQRALLTETLTHEGLRARAEDKRGRARIYEKLADSLAKLAAAS